MPNPFITFVVRHHAGRPTFLQENRESLEMQTDPDWNRLVITDTVGYKIWGADKVLWFTREFVTGDYVMVLDDDDRLLDSEFVAKMKKIAEEHDPDVIAFKFWWPVGWRKIEYLPDDRYWGKRPVRGHWGSCCHIVKRELWQKYIRWFGWNPSQDAGARGGDFWFIQKLWDESSKFYFHDEIMGEVQEIGNGRPESETRLSGGNDTTPRASVASGTYNRVKILPQFRLSGRTMKLTIFTIPREFTGLWSVIQRNAIGSWIRLTPKPRVILIGCDSGVQEVAEQEYGVLSLPVARNGYGTPLVNDAFARAAEVTKTDVLAYANCDCILVDDLPQAIGHVSDRFNEFLAVSRRYNWETDEPLDFGPGWAARLRRRVRKSRGMQGPYGVELFAWRGDFWGEIPPFAVGRRAYDNWLVWRALDAGVPVVDMSADVTVVHQAHDRGDRRTGMEAKRNIEMMGKQHERGTQYATWELVNGSVRKRE